MSFLFPGQRTSDITHVGDLKPVRLQDVDPVWPAERPLFGSCQVSILVMENGFFVPLCFKVHCVRVPVVTMFVAAEYHVCGEGKRRESRYRIWAIWIKNNGKPIFSTVKQE